MMPSYQQIVVEPIFVGDPFITLLAIIPDFGANFFD
jgi:hypothetical protein